MNVAFPFRIDRRGQTAAATEEAHVRELIEQVLFTSPGERVNRPAFGSGLRQLVFAPNSEELAAAVSHLVEGALQQYVGDRIQLEGVQVRSDEARLLVTVRYTLSERPDVQEESFSHAL